MNELRRTLEVEHSKLNEHCLLDRCNSRICRISSKLRNRLGRVLAPSHLMCSIKCPGDSALDIFGYFNFSKLVEMISGRCYRIFATDLLAIR